MASFTWVTSQPAFESGIKGFAHAYVTAIHAQAVANIAPMLADYVKQNHHWQNRTGRLEASIAPVARLVDDHTVEMGVAYDSDAVSEQGYPYGARLEYDYGGQYAILRSSLLVNGPRIWDMVRMTRPKVNLT